MAHAQAEPERLWLGADADAGTLAAVSNRAARHCPNLRFVRAAVEALPAELDGAIDDLHIVLPWGSLLQAALMPASAGGSGIARSLRAGGRLSVTASWDPARDARVLSRLALSAADFDPGCLAARYALAGYTGIRVALISAAEAKATGSTWAKRLANTPGRRFVRLTAIAEGVAHADPE